MINNPAFNYDAAGHGYSAVRRADPRIEAVVHAALADARSVLNVGAGAGSYEPADRYVVAVEPSRVMRAQRLALGRVPAIDATASRLPFDDGAFDASMATVTVHHWPDLERGLQEMRRVTRRRVLVLTFDPDALNNFWNAQYFPELVEVERKRYPSIDRITEALGGNATVMPVPIPFDCTDGFQEAWYGRPEAFLQPEIRKAQSAWSFLAEGLEDVLVHRLAHDLASGAWDAKYGNHRTLPTFTGALRLITAAF